jgi:hypothetical protein
MRGAREITDAAHGAGYGTSRVFAISVVAEEQRSAELGGVIRAIAFGVV